MKQVIQPKVKRNYKDTLFRMIFNDEENLLSLFHTVSGKCYTDAEQLEIVTLENAIYMNMKNDLAFVIDCSLHLYEHQSTDCPNMPLRHLFYVAREYEKMIHKQSIYSTRPISLPTPYFLVFYNGADVEWTERTSKLSDLFQTKESEPNLELFVKEININVGKNVELMNNCKPLLEYMQYIEKVRTYKQTLELNQAVELAVNESIREGILVDFLLQHKTEAIQVSIFEFDEEREKELIRADERYMGRKQGLEEGKNQERILFIQGSLNENIPKDTIIDRLVNWFGVAVEEAMNLVQSVMMLKD